MEMVCAVKAVAAMHGPITRSKRATRRARVDVSLGGTVRRKMEAGSTNTRATDDVAPAKLKTTLISGVRMAMPSSAPMSPKVVRRWRNHEKGAPEVLKKCG